jgi:phage recombination protein Bet
VSTEVATTQGGQGTLALRGDQIDWTPVQRAALDQIGITEAPIGDQQVFLHVCQRTGLDPFARQIYLIGRRDRDSPTGKKWTIQTGIDGFRLFCERDNRYAGEGDPAAEWCGPDGVWKEMWADDDNPPVAARFTVRRVDQDNPVRGVAHYREYVQTKFDGEPNQMWRTKAAGQLAKCAEALARRRLFPQDLSNVYTDDEMAHLENPERPMVIDSPQRQEDQEPDWDLMIKNAEARQDKAALTEVWKLARGLRANDTKLLERIAAAGERVTALLAEPPAKAAEPAVNVCVVDESVGGDSGPAEKTQRNRLFALLRDGGVNGSDRAMRLRIVSRILNMPPATPVTSFDQLTASEVTTINDFLQRHKDDGDLIHTLAELGVTHPEAAEEPPHD